MARLPLVLLAVLAAAGCSSAEEVTAGGEAPLTADDAQLAHIRELVQNVEQEHVSFTENVIAPTGTAGDGIRGDGVSLYGLDWYQKWAGGRSADHAWANGSPAGRRCMWASVARFEAIMRDAPPELEAFLREYPTWSGDFYNWNDDYSGTGPEGQPAYGDAHGARLWAWKNDLTKWITQTARDGSCYLPTRTMVLAYVRACRERIASHGGAMKDCQAD